MAATPLLQLGPYNYSYHLLILTFLQTNFASPKGDILRLGKYDNANPRTDIDRIEKDGKVPPHVIARVRRRQAAHENCYDNLGIFAAAVVAGNQAGLGGKFMNTMAGGYFLIRCIYIYSYIKTTSKRASYIRSACWWGSNFCFLTTLWKVGTAINGRGLLVLTILQAFAITPRITIARLGFLDNVHPRQALDKMEKLEKWDKVTIRRLRRRQAAHENCLESLGAVCAAVVAGNTAGLSSGFMTYATATYFLLRCAFIYLYLEVTDNNLSLSRTIVWYTLTSAYLTIFWRAGNALLAKGL